MWKAQFSSHAVEGRSGRQAAQAVGAPQVQILASDPDSTGQLGLTDAVGALLGVDELDQVRSLHSSECPGAPQVSSRDS